MEDEEDLIDAEIQKQLGEISLADLESDDIAEEEIFTQDIIGSYISLKIFLKYLTIFIIFYMNGNNIA